MLIGLSFKSVQWVFHTCFSVALDVLLFGGTYFYLGAPVLGIRFRGVREAGGGCIRS